MFPPHTNILSDMYVNSLPHKKDCYLKKLSGGNTKAPKHSVERSWTSTFGSSGKSLKRMVINLFLIIGNCELVAQRRSHKKINPMYYRVF